MLVYRQPYVSIGAGRLCCFSPDLVVRAQADPVRDRPVLLHLLAQGHLGAEGLVGRLCVPFSDGDKRKTSAGNTTGMASLVRQQARVSKPKRDKQPLDVTATQSYAAAG